MEFLEFRRFWESEDYAVTRSIFKPGCHYFIRKCVGRNENSNFNYYMLSNPVYSKREIKLLKLEDLQQDLCSYRLRELFK